MKFWLIVFMFTPEGEFMAKDVYETPSKIECSEMAGRVVKTLVNTQLQSQFYCVSDDHYNGRSIDEGIALD